MIEERHGFNKTTLELFFRDLVKGTLIGLVMQCVTLSSCIVFLQAVQKHTRSDGADSSLLVATFWLWVLLVVLLWVYPNVIQPLFNTYEPLKDEALRKKVEELAESQNFPVCDIYQVDGSTWSGHSNAYLQGFWKFQRIVVYDNFLDRPHDEILATLGHELGHWKGNHIIFNCIFQVTTIVLRFTLASMLFSADTQDLYASFGMQEASHSIIVAGQLICSILLPFDWIMARVMICLSRVFEFQADAYAVELGYGAPLKEALKNLHLENKGSLNDDPWYCWYVHSHPGLVERLRAINAKMASMEKNASAKKED